MTGLEAEAIFEQLGGRKYEEACRRGWFFDKLDLYFSVDPDDRFTSVHILGMGVVSRTADDAVWYLKDRLAK